MRFLPFVSRVLLVSAIFLSSFWLPAYADDGVRELKRIAESTEPEHVVIFIVGWQLGDPCLIAGSSLIDGISCNDIYVNPAWSWDYIKQDLCKYDYGDNACIDFDAADMLIGHNIQIPSYPGNAEAYPTDGINESRVVYYSYSGGYRYILDKAEDEAFDSVIPGSEGECEPYQQLEEPREFADPNDNSTLKYGYQCLPYFSRADTSIIAEKVNDKTLLEGLISNIETALVDELYIENFAKGYIQNYWKGPIAPGLSAGEAAEDFVETVIFDTTRRTLEEYGFSNGLLEENDHTAQRELFTQRAEYLQDLIDSVVDYYGGNAEITLVGHSQGGLVAAFWAGWDGKDATHVNAIVTLDSPLGRHLSGYGLSKTVLRWIPDISLSVTLPAVSVPFWGELFPERDIEILNYPLGKKLQAAFSDVKFKMVLGTDDVIEQASSDVPIYTVRNLRDLFVTSKYAGLDGRAWHDKEVDLSGDLDDLKAANHELVRVNSEVAQDIQFTVVSGSIYTPNSLEPLVLAENGPANRRLRIRLSAPAFTRSNNDRYPTREDFRVELLASGSVQAAYVLDVVSVVEESFYASQTGRGVNAPPLSLSASLPQQIAPGTYDLVVTYDGEIAPASRATSYRSVQVNGGGDFSSGSIILVIDTSGSMRFLSLTGNGTKIEDAQLAATYLAELTSTTGDNRLGVLEFNTTNSRAYPSGPLVEVTNSTLPEFLDAINSLSASGATFLTAALVNARQWFDEGNISHQARAIIALTDGDADDSWLTNFTDVPVYTVGFSAGRADLDEVELRRIANDTGGYYTYAPSQIDLRVLYDTIQRQVSGENGIIQLVKTVSPTTEFVDFIVDPTVDRFRLSVNWDALDIPDVELSVITPSGIEIDKTNFQTIGSDVTIFSSPGSWTFSATSFEAGQWQLAIRGAQVANTAGTLNITSSSSSPVQLEVSIEPNSGNLFESLFTPISLTDFDPLWGVNAIEEARAFVTLPSGERVEIDLYDDGYHGDGVANDLIFSAVVPSPLVYEIGSYIIDVVVRGLLAERATGEVFSSSSGETLPFERIFSTIRQVNAVASSSLEANLASMVVKKPSTENEYCVSYANYGPGDANEVGLFISADNAGYVSASQPATRNLEKYSFGWNLGRIDSGAAGVIETTLVTLDPGLSTELASWISDGVFTEDQSLDQISYDSDTSDNSSLSLTDLSVVQLDAGWTLIGFDRQPSVSTPRSLLCAIDGPIDVMLGYDGSGLTYDPAVDEHFNTLDFISVLNGYWIRSDEARQLHLSGSQTPVDTPIELSIGWNLVNYLPETAQDVPSALASIDGLYDAVLGYDQGALSYYSNIPPRLSTLQIMEPGNAYWIHMNRASTLVYSKTAESQEVASAALNQPQRPSRVTVTNQWVNFYSERVTVDGKPAPVGTVVEAYTQDGIKIGEAQVVEPGIMQLLTAYGDDAYTPSKDGANWGEQVTFLITGVPATVYSEPNSANWQGHGKLIPLRIGIEPNLPNKVYMPFINR